MRKLWQNRYTTLWEVNPEWSYPAFAYGTGVFRIMWCGPDDHRVILVISPQHSPWGFDFPEGATLELHLKNPKEEPEVYKEEERIMRFHDCKVKRKWIKRPKALSSEETEHIRFHVELSCIIEVFDGEI